MLKVWRISHGNQTALLRQRLNLGHFAAVLETETKPGLKWGQAKKDVRAEGVELGFVIVGIDPGSQFTGFGAVQVDRDAKSRGPLIAHVEHRVFEAKTSWDFSSRLAFMHEKLCEALCRVRPKAVAIERIFLGRNPDSAFKLGHVRGVCMLAAQQSQADVFEYAARSVKKGVTGNGASSKDQVQLILFAALGVRGTAQLDASDALALAFYHARNMEIEDNLRRGLAASPG